MKLELNSFEKILHGFCTCINGRYKKRCVESVQKLPVLLPFIANINHCFEIRNAKPYLTLSNSHSAKNIVLSLDYPGQVF
ncbi:MAG: hypothetical protein JNJ56_12600 [Ignavibacteria bacterium]|nr:hypothetical protein [Ignavibacteria bacterium]